jgi:hypothetical protein
MEIMVDVFDAVDYDGDHHTVYGVRPLVAHPDDPTKLVPGRIQLRDQSGNAVNPVDVNRGVYLVVATNTLVTATSPRWPLTARPSVR